jgi:hypothetical protein
VPPTSEDMTTAVKGAEALVTKALPLGAVDAGCRAERERFRAIAFTEVLRELLGSAQPG